MVVFRCHFLVLSLFLLILVDFFIVVVLRMFKLQDELVIQQLEDATRMERTPPCVDKVADVVLLSLRLGRHNIATVDLRS